MRSFFFLIAGCILWTHLAVAKQPVYVMLWFDTEDYIDTQSDDAALRIANDLTRLGVRATFKVTGEKARMLQSRGREDVIRALSHHSIGYHTNFHSIQPAPAVYLERFGILDGTEEFVRRERPGIQSIERVFGVKPVCYGQPGSSWAPQVFAGLRQWGVSVYLDEGSQVGLRDQPFWYGGLLNIFNLGRFVVRPNLEDEAKNEAVWEKFIDDVNRLSDKGGVISTYFHPTEFVNKEFWDAVNFSNGEVRPREQWVAPPLYSAAEAERHFRVLTRFVERAKKIPNVQFITADDALHLYQSQSPVSLDKAEIAKRLRGHITFIESPKGDLSAAEAATTLFGVPADFVDGPTRAGATTYSKAEIPDWLFDKAAADVRDFIATEHRLPPEVFLGAETLSLADFVATFAEHTLTPGPARVVRGNVDFGQYVSSQEEEAFHWPIHPPGFKAPHVLEMARLLAWTLKPARLK